MIIQQVDIYINMIGHTSI